MIQKERKKGREGGREKRKKVNPLTNLEWAVRCNPDIAFSPPPPFVFARDKVKIEDRFHILWHSGCNYGVICLSTSAPSFHSALRALTFQLLKGVNIPGRSPAHLSLSPLIPLKAPWEWRLSHFGRRERAVEFPLRRDGYAKRKEEEEEAERRVSQRREGVRGEKLRGLAWLTVSLQSSGEA